MNPKLSIIIPTRNRGQELVTAVESALMLADRVTTEIIVVSSGERKRVHLAKQLLVNSLHNYRYL